MNAALLVVLVVFVFSGCIANDNGGFGECVQIEPPAPGWCSNGTVVSGGTDECGCAMPPRCLQANYCLEEQREVDICTAEYAPVCGRFGRNIQCFAYPCAMTYGNPCEACQNPDVDYWTEGRCPAVGSNP